MIPKPKILIVDDEPVVTKSCERILAGTSYDVVTTNSGLEGLELAMNETFNLVVTDLKMPDLDGMDLVRKLRKTHPETSVIVITGYGSVPNAVEAIRLGVKEFIEKPFTPDEISEAVVRGVDDSLTEVGPDGHRIEADLVKEVLKAISRDNAFAFSLWQQGSRVLEGYALSPEAQQAIASGDVAWIEKHCGELTNEERTWLERRLSAERW